ncbi:chalcone isomerase-like protein [Thermochaetoides thermophila DSM 1495]|uniref:Chalcone isomerase-like protein n=1 Tax=Chaetomium thermophilum (strain DSM 1495 / CBS 144.50 / IMI 039719) TaxID=759272 RepID=G0SH64_CHATD|nr:chalcone isomerase-like protein [Thermochaetoides thermophila DSM 1495]EGS17553.1 chalcone isomerase-like protein [Thermochaetoides thermophila DSM 1495]
MLRQSIGRRLPGVVKTPSLQPHIARRTFLFRHNKRPPTRAVENLNIYRLAQQSEEYHRQRRIFLWCGTIAGIVSFIYTAWKLKRELDKGIKFDTEKHSASDLLSGANVAGRQVIVHDDQGCELVPTGNNTVPTFPRTITLSDYSSNPSSSSAFPGSPARETEYTLVGMGVRTVTFVNLQVYLVGYYVATTDLAALQSALIKHVNPIATTLIPEERDQLRTQLLDNNEGERIWNDLLARGIPARSAFRIVPVRDTDFHHLRDGFVRAIQARAPSIAGNNVDDEAFGEAVRKFRAAFKRGSVPKRRELLLIRDQQGKLALVYDSGKNERGSSSSRQLLGTVEDERLTRALWLNWLAGKKVASEAARKNIVDGIMGFVERPVGTVEAQVVPVVKAET